VQLPLAEMSSSGIGPLSQPMRSWVYSSAAIVEPEWATLMWDATSRYMAASLALTTVTAATGVMSARFEVISRRRFAQIEWLNSYSYGATPLNVMAETTMASFGWVNGLGRILQSVRGLSTTAAAGGCQSTMLTYLLSPALCQWEEALPYVASVPYSAAIYSYLFEVRPKADLPVRSWVSCTSIDGRIGTSDAMYCVQRVEGSIMGYARLSKHSDGITYRRTAARQAYSGRLADHQFLDLPIDEGVLWRPVFQFPTTTAMLTAHLSGIRAMDNEWYIDEQKSATFMATLAEFIAPSDGAETTTSTGSPPSAIDPDEGLRREREAITEQAARIAEQAERRAKLAKDVADQEPNKPAGAMSKPDIGLQTWSDKVSEVLGMQPEFVRILLKLATEDADPIAAAHKQPALVQQMLNDVKEMNPLDYVYYVDANDRGVALTLMGNLLSRVAPYAPSGASAMDLLRLTTACRQLGAQMRVSPILSAEEFESTTSRSVREDVKPLIMRGLKAGLPLGEIVNTDDAAALEERIAQNERLLEAAVQEQFGELDSSRWTDETELDPPHAEPEPGPSIASTSTAAPTDIPHIADTPSNFGGAPSSAAPSDPPPPSIPSAPLVSPAPAAAPTSASLSTAAFEGQVLHE
jgi:hypothetical protein